MDQRSLWPVTYPFPTLRSTAVGTALTLALLAPLGAGALAQEDAAVELEYAQIKPLAVESLLLDADAAGDLMVAVGERGHILRSRDQGTTWEQAESVPTRALLTAVTLHDENLGWAVGHDATIVRTTDGGATWELQYSAPEEELPLLDVRFEDAERGVAIGAYGYFLETFDGGASWEFADFDPEAAAGDEEEAVEDDPFAYDVGGDFHLNQIARSASGRLYIAAEAGSVYRSDDDRESWLTLASPYEGSFFGSLPLEEDSVLLFGLRGHLFRSEDAGETWVEIETGTQAILTDAARLADGTVVICGLEGTVLLSRDGGRTFTLQAQPDRQGFSSVLPLADGGILLFGEFGVTTLAASALGAG